MAKVNYCDPSATYDGDGTSSAQAASNGAVGAWNSLRKAFTGTVTYGSLVAGDEVVIRSHNGADLTVVDNAALSIMAGVIFTVDDGTVWATGGTLTWQQTTAAIDITIGAGVVIKAGFDRATDLPKFKFQCPGGSRNDDWIKPSTCFLDGVWFHSVSTAAHNQGISVATNGRAIFNNCRFSNYLGGGYAAGIIAALNTVLITLRNPIIDFQSGTTLPATAGFFDGAGRGSVIRSFGGKCVNTTVYSRLLALGESNIVDANATIEIDGLELNGCNISEKRMESTYLSSVVSPDGNCFYSDGGGQIDWYSGKNFPTLNAINQHGTAWSFRCLPSLTSAVGNACKINRLRKFYTSTAAPITLTIELCIKDTSAGSGAFDSPLEQDCVAVFTYVDATTESTVTVSTPITLEALTASSATWVPEVGGQPVYGSNNYDKYKLTATTPTNVLEDSWVMCEVYFNRPRIYDDDYFFVDPDIQFS
jgi:hypothetical protein